MLQPNFIIFIKPVVNAKTYRLVWLDNSTASFKAACLPMAVSNTDEKQHRFRVRGKTDVNGMGNRRSQP